MSGLMRHVEAVQNVTLPGERLPFKLSVEQVGWVRRDAVPLLLEHGCIRESAQEDSPVVLPWTENLEDLAQRLAQEGAFTWRGEAFDVRGDFDGKVLARIDRGALPWFGIRAEGVHVNGVVTGPGGLHLWVAQRSADRMMDPGKLDHLVAGGIAAGMNAETTLMKEGSEEAGFSPAIIDRAVYAGSLRYTALRREGLRRDRLHCYDLELPSDIIPVPTDGEVASFELWPVDRVVETLRETDRFKFNVSVVLIDFLLRWRVLPPNEETSALKEIFRK